MEKKLKKQTDLKLAILKHKTEKNEEKRKNAARNFELKNSEIDSLGYQAFGKGLQDAEKRVKSNFDSDQ